MPLLAVGDKLEVVLVCRLGGQDGLIVRHYDVQAITGASLDISQVPDTISTDLGGPLKACMSDQAEYRGVRVRRLAPGATDVFTSALGNGPGTSASDVLPTQASGLISLRTGFAGRSKRGRAYVPFPSEAFNDADGHPTAAYKGLLNTFGTALRTNILAVVGADGVELDPVIRSKLLDSYFSITSHLVRAEFATQRRRSQINRGDLPPIP